jgi:membrane protease YdiL (CAAX protease family)
VDLASSRLLAGARAAVRLPHPALAVALVLLFEIAPLALLVTVLAADVLPQELLSSALAQSALFGSVFGLYVVQLWLWVRFRERRSVATLGLHRQGASWRLLRGALVGVAVYLAILTVLVLTGMAGVRSEPSAGPGWALSVAALIALVGWAVQGPAEELLFRGWLLPVVTARAGLRWGIAVSSGLFALTHLLGGDVNLMMFLNLLLFGVFFAVWALREGSLWGVFGWHAAVNWVSENLVVVGEGAGVGPLTYGLLLGLDESGPDLLTGGTVGVESSLITTAVLVVGIAAICRWPRRRRRSRAGGDRAAPVRAADAA